MPLSEIREISLSVLPEDVSDSRVIIKELRKKKELKGFNLNSYKIIRKSIDARKKPVKVNLGILVSEADEINFKYNEKKYLPVASGSPGVIIVGAGPAGLFAGLRAIERGFRPIILERGEDVESRRQTLADISRKGEINPDSNYSFGEGGAGAFSDGKLFTRSKKRGSVKEVLEILHQFGASEDILIQSHPHIGSDKLPGIIKRIREKIKECGGEVRFNTRMEEIILEKGKAVGVRTSEGEVLKGPVFLATGHSARDTFSMLYEKGVNIEAKGIAVGVRLEHPQKLIDCMQYHSKEGAGDFLPPAEYSFVHQVEGRGVYSFCMCPGGVIVPAVTENGQIVVNGMSASARSGKWANSGYVVEIHPDDLEEFEKEGPFRVLAFQENLEKKFSESSNGSLKAPAQKIPDFIEGKISEELPSTSYAPGLISVDLNTLFPRQLSSRLKGGLMEIGKKCKEFIGSEGVMIGLESRTSSPIRIPRDAQSFEHTDIKNLYPVGEGAGYAGGIVSSAIDGINSIDSYYKKIKGDEC